MENIGGENKMKTIYDKIQFQIAELCCQCYDLGKNDDWESNFEEWLKEKQQ